MPKHTANAEPIGLLDLLKLMHLFIENFEVHCDDPIKKVGLFFVSNFAIPAIKYNVGCFFFA